MAVLATLIWSGNFIVARGIYLKVPPVTLAFFRWLCASVVIFPFAWKYLRKEWLIIRKHLPYLILAALTGVALFNTLVYIGAKYTSAINLALIGTTSSPIISVILAGIFLKEHIGWKRWIGLALCITGVFYLISNGNFQQLMSLEFTQGDGWVLLAGAAFAIYNTMVKRKPAGISAINFLFVIFSLGTLMLLPFYIWENANTPAVSWNFNLLMILLYLGIGASVISFLLWNRAILILGAGRAAIFGNLIPVFATFEAVLILGERITWVHGISFGLVITGLLISNMAAKRI